MGIKPCNEIDDKLHKNEYENDLRKNQRNNFQKKLLQPLNYKL